MENNLSDFKKIPTAFMDEIEIKETEFFKETTAPDINEENNLPGPGINNDTPGGNFDISEGMDAPGEQPAKIADILDADMITGLYEVIILSVTGIAFNLLDLEFNKKEASFTASEKKLLRPVLKQVVDKYLPDINDPLTMLVISTGIIIGGRLLPAYADKSAKKGKRPKDENKAENEAENNNGGTIEPSKYLVKKYGYNEAKRRANS